MARRYDPKDAGTQVSNARMSGTIGPSGKLIGKVMREPGSRPTAKDWAAKSAALSRATGQQPGAEKAAAEVASKKLGIETLATRNSDSHDFHEVSGAGLKAAIDSAYARGHLSVAGHSPTTAPAGVVAKIAGEHLGGRSLETKGSDRQDFKEEHVASIKKALVAAHDAGAKDAKSLKEKAGTGGDDMPRDDHGRFASK
jgi:hypothetical protein